MLTPTNVKNSCCIQQIRDFKSIDNEAKDILVQNIIFGFEQSPSYEPVYVNYDLTKVYKTWIQEGNKKDKIVGFKELISYPYEQIKFKVGDFISWKYRKDVADLSVWLVESFNEQQYYDARGRILECNQKIKWRKSSVEVESVDCVLMDNMTYVNFLGKGTDGLVEPNASIVVMTQNNDKTDYIKKNRRFIFGDNVYLVKQTFRGLNDNFLKIFLTEVPKQNEDDFVNGIAWNGEDLPVETDNKTVILPEVDFIRLAQEVTFDVFKYVANVQSTDTFTISVSGVSNEYYSLTIIDGNKFKINNLKENKQNQLVISCKNNITNEITTKNIWLKGRWG